MNFENNILFLQKICRGYLQRNNTNNIFKLIKFNILKNNNKHNNLFIKCKKISKKYNPAKNEYKFIYGGLIQKSLIDFFNEIFYKCVDLDELTNIGAEYKFDCKLKITKFININLGIKAKLRKKGNIIMINKQNTDREYNLEDLISIIIIIELNDIIIIPHKYIDNKYIINGNANISYKSSLITKLYNEKSKYIIHLKENEKYNEFMKNEYPYIQNHNIYQELYKNL